MTKDNAVDSDFGNSCDIYARQNCRTFNLIKFTERIGVVEKIGV
jgi:hypothetical protein